VERQWVRVPLIARKKSTESVMVRGLDHCAFFAAGFVLGKPDFFLFFKVRKNRLPIFHYSKGPCETKKNNPRRLQLFEVGLGKQKSWQRLVVLRKKKQKIGHSQYDRRNFCGFAKKFSIQAGAFRCVFGPASLFCALLPTNRPPGRIPFA